MICIIISHAILHLYDDDITYLDMLFQVLGTLEGFTAEVALVWLQRYMDTNMRSDMITLDSGGLALIPLASKVQVVGALAANMLLTYVLLKVIISLIYGYINGG